MTQEEPKQLGKRICEMQVISDALTEEGISNSLYEVVVLKGWEGQPFTEQRRMFKAEEAKYGGKKEAFCSQW